MSNRRKLVIVLCSCFVLLIALPPFAFNGESVTIDANIRARAQGSFATVLDGQVHYELAGPQRAPVVVLVHGFSTPYYVWDAVVPTLHSAGFKTLRFDLFGRGLSDRPDVVYNLSLFDRQLVGLLDSLNIKGQTHVVGLSMGGAITAHFAIHHPERVAKLGLIAPFGFPQPSSVTERLVRAPLIGEWLMASIGDRTLRGGQGGNFKHPERHQGFYQKFEEQMRFRGYKRALLSSLRTVVSRDHSELYAGVGKLRKPVLLIWGRDDAVVPFANNELVRRAIPTTRFVPVDDSGHLPLVEQPDVVNQALIDFLK